jgi:2-polyprenyl-6-methoxyphenol hydroxylase-like FAD-dependent oxidoreductase
MITKKIAIVGCGPVGMFGSLLFEHFNIDYVTVEKHPSIRAHPSAHWINPSTKTLFGQIPNLV